MKSLFYHSNLRLRDVFLIIRHYFPKPCDTALIDTSKTICTIMAATIMYKFWVWDPNVSDFSRPPGKKELVYPRRSEGCLAASKVGKPTVLIIQSFQTELA